MLSFSLPGVGLGGSNRFDEFGGTFNHHFLLAENMNVIAIPQDHDDLELRVGHDQLRQRTSFICIRRVFHEYNGRLQTANLIYQTLKIYRLTSDCVYSGSGSEEHFEGKIQRRVVVYDEEAIGTQSDHPAWA